MSVPTFPCPSGETCFAPECCAHRQCMHAEEQPHEQPQAPPQPSKDRARFTLAADAFFDLFPKESGCDETDPRMVVLFELMDKAAAVAHAQWLEAAPAAKTATPTDTEILDSIEARAREIWGENGRWSSSEAGMPSYVDTSNEIFCFATLRESAIAAIRGEDPGFQAETPLTECANPECPVGCPDSHAAPPSYFEMVDAGSEPDEPVVQEVNRGQ